MQIVSKTMISELSGATIVIFIALGALVLLLLFIFAKRQIMRFTLRSRRGPHVPVGHSAPRVKNFLFLLYYWYNFYFWFIQWLRKEIEKRLDLVVRVKHEPKQISETIHTDTTNADTYCRMQAIDDIKVLGCGF